MSLLPSPFASGRYVPVRRIGAGGMAEVWEVEDARLAVRRALKVLPVGGADDDIRARLAQEARILARLVHPHVVTVLDVGEEPDGRAWLVMELLSGGTLEAWIARNGPLHPREAGRVLLGVLDALGVAHAAGVVHRDVKPQNLLVASEPFGSARLKLADFGIARLRDAHDLTRTGTLMGSWALMAPEQRLDARHVGPASDLFAAAGTLVWMVHGAPVSDLHVVEHRTALLASWPPTLAGVCHRALAFRPEQRFHSASAFAEALRFALAQEAELAAVLPGSRPWAEGGFDVEVASPTLAQEVSARSADAADSWGGGGPAPLRNASPGASHTSRGAAATWAVAACVLGLTVGAIVGDSKDVLERAGVVEVPEAVARERAWAALPVCEDARAVRTTSYLGPRESIGATIVDVDGDQVQDMVFANQLDKSLSVYFRDGGERWQPPVTVPAGRIVGQVTMATIDGQRYLVATRSDASQLVWFRVDGRMLSEARTDDQPSRPRHPLLANWDSRDGEDLVFETDDCIRFRSGMFRTKQDRCIIDAQGWRLLGAYQQGARSQLVVRTQTGVSILSPAPDGGASSVTEVLSSLGADVVTWANLEDGSGVLLRVHPDGRVARHRSADSFRIGCVVATVNKNFDFRNSRGRDVDGDGRADIVGTVICEECTSRHVLVAF